MNQVELSAAALHEWSRHVDAVLRGVSHALNNRSAALSALIQLADDSEPADTLRSILASELDRVTQLAAAIRTVGAPRAGEEAFSPGDAAAEAQQVLVLHADQRDATTQFEANSAPPIRVQRALFVRALIVLAATAARDTRNVRIAISASEDDVVVSADGAKAESAFVEEAARLMGGAAIPGLGFRVPSLAALRRREGS